MILETIFLIIIFIWFWLWSFLWHELMHNYEAYRQNAVEYCIIPDFKSWTMHASYMGIIRDKDRVSLAGGLYTGLLLLPVACMMLFLRYTLVYVPLFTVACVQICYGLFEWRYIRHTNKYDYLLGRYLVYGLVIIVMGIIWFGLWKYGVLI